MGSSTDRRLVPLICVLLALFTIGAYWQVTGHQFVNYDDDDYVASNPRIRAIDAVWAFTTFHEANWHPLTWLSHMIDYRLFGLNAGWHHATNLLLHIASTILLFLVLRRMTGFTWRAAFVAALFAIHPLHVESVAWVAERKDVLSTFFLMLALLAYARYAEHPGIGRYLLVMGAFALGLMSKPMLVTLPVILLLLDWWPLGRVSNGKGWTLRRLVIEKLPLIALAAASGVITFIAQDRGLAVGSLEHYPIGVRIANALVAYVSYLVKMVYPTKLTVFYPHPESSLPMWQVIGSAVILLGVTALVLRVRRTRPYLAVGWLWYLVTLLPVIGLVQVGMQAMADRYTYVPLVGAFVAVAWLIGRIVPIRLVRLLAVLIVAALMPLTWRQVGCWRDSETLFRHALAVTERNAVAENNLGLALVEQKQFDEAVGHHRSAVEYAPDWADARYSLGAALLRNDQPAEAVAEFEAALTIDGNHASAHQNLGAALIRLGDLPGAIRHLKRAIEIRPDYAHGYSNLGTAYSLQGKLDESVECLSRAVEIDPSLADAHYNLAIDLGQQSRIPEAIEACRRALALRPKWPEAQNNLAWFLASSPDRTLPDAEEAVRLAEQACRASRNTNPQFLDTLAAAKEALALAQK